MDFQEDPLLRCLVIFTRLYHQPFEPDALTDGLPVEEGFATPELFSLKGSKSLFSRAAKRAGFASTLVKRELTKVPDLVLPAILLLKDKNAVVLLGFDENKEYAKVILPEVSDGESWIKVSVLENEYIGYTFFLKRTRKSENINKTLKKESDHWFFSTLMRSKKIYFDVLVASLVINLFVLATPLFTMNVYDRVVPNGAIDTMWVMAIGIMIVYSFDLLLKFIRTYFLETAGKKSDIIMSSIIFEHVLNLKTAVKPKSVGSFANTLKEFESIRSFFTASTISTLIDIPFVFIFLLVINFIGSELVLVPLSIIVFITIYSLSIKGPLQRSIESTFEASSHKNSILIEALTNHETIKTLGAAGHTQWLWEESTGEIANKSLKSRILSTSITTVTQFLVQLNTVAILIVGVYMIDDMRITMGGLIATVILASRAVAPFGQFAALLSQYAQTKTALNSINQVMELPTDRPHGKKFVQRDILLGNIEFKDVTFTYPDEQRPTFKNFNLKINAGEKIAIIGRIGSGKTTLEKLIMGIYNADSGSVLIDGIDVNQSDPANIRNNISYVPQVVSLFKGTMKDNIVYKTPNAEDFEIIEAAKIGVLDEFINSHPKGYDLDIGEGGVGLSGGQQQCVAIARAFIKDSPIVLLDEPSNSMDNSTEKELIDRLKVKIKDKTSIIITHKTSLLELVDRVIVMEHGQIAFDGPKSEVVTRFSNGGK